MSRRTPEDDAESASTLSADNPSLESLAELGASMLLLRNAATEVVSAVEHARSAATSLWDALNYLSDSNSVAGDASAALPDRTGNVTRLLGGRVASGGTGGDSANPLGVVGQIFSRATSAGGTVPSNPVTAMTDALTDVLGAAGGRSSARGKEQSASDRPQPADNGGSVAHPPPATSVAESPTSSSPKPTSLVTGILGANPLTDMAGKVIDAAAKPVVDQVGEGLRQAQRIATAPLAGVGDVLEDVLEKVVGSGTRDETEALRKRGNKLIRISYKPELQRRDVHPSFSHILDELLPDEARIVRFLGVAGAQPMIDVRTKTLFQIGSVLLVGGVSMVASMAGCHWSDRDQHYFANLNRLGLVDLSPEPVADYRRYALLEVQPVALHAIEGVPKAITIYRSIGLTAFGSQFIEVCINTEGYNAGGWDTDGRQDKIRGKRHPDHAAETA
jgi:hypothetical protein